MANTPYTTTAITGGSGIYQLSFNFPLANIAAANLITSYVINHNFRILDIRAVVTIAATTISKAATLTAQIGSVAIPGAVLALTSANCTPQGAIITATSTAQLSGGLQDAAGGSNISIVGSAVTAFVEGEITLVITVQDRADA